MGKEYDPKNRARVLKELEAEWGWQDIAIHNATIEIKDRKDNIKKSIASLIKLVQKSGLTLPKFIVLGTEETEEGIERVKGFLPDTLEFGFIDEHYDYEHPPKIFSDAMNFNIYPEDLKDVRKTDRLEEDWIEDGPMVCSRIVRIAKNLTVRPNPLITQAQK